MALAPKGWGWNLQLWCALAACHVTAVTHGDGGAGPDGHSVGDGTRAQQLLGGGVGGFRPIRRQNNQLFSLLSAPGSFMSSFWFEFDLNTSYLNYLSFVLTSCVFWVSLFSVVHECVCVWEKMRCTTWQTTCMEKKISATVKRFEVCLGGGFCALLVTKLCVN